MTPALAFIVLLQNAVVTCEQHLSIRTELVYDAGFEQCGYLVPRATKLIDDFYAGPGPAAQLAADKALIAKAVAAVAAHR